MKSKFEKVLNIVLFSILGACAIAILVIYIISPSLVQSGFEYVVDLLNKPLPIVGITVGAVLIFLWKVIVATNYGKKQIASLEKQYKEKYEQLKSEKEKLEQEREENKEQIRNIENSFVELCAIFPNKKVNDFGENFAKGLDYGEKSTGNEEKAN